MSKSYKHLYLPIEESARELNARLLLVIAAMQAGYRVVIGQQWLLINNLQNLAPGIVFFKGSNKVQSNWMHHASKHGHRIVAIDEEVTAIADRRFVLKEICPDSLPLIDRFFLQGQNQFDIYVDEFPEHRSRFMITGNPRFDLLRKEFTQAFNEDAEKYRAQYGRYILINTNFGYVNTAWGKPENFVQVCENVGYIDRENAEDRKFLSDFYDLEVMNMAGFKVMIRKLRDRFPDHKVIVRPHPAENVEAWKDALSGEERIHVVFEGSAVPWILGADYFIHNTCTTGTEAMVLGVPVGAYAFYTNWVESIFLSNLVTPVFREMESLFSAVEMGIRDRKGAVKAIREDRDSVLRQHISGLDKILATAGIFHGVDNLEVEMSSGPVYRDGKGLKVGVQRSPYQRKKIDLGLKELNQKLTNLVKVTGIGFSAKAEKIGDSLFIITPID
ncbi:surface carbohydrate biosynthesis protein [Nisaea sp.]|uniref:surface carbohydrate biosynthesis protein n=1 Tax=Nisaea sp. TaxID=2024842 RepID=UPI0032EFC94E